MCSIPVYILKQPHDLGGRKVGNDREARLFGKSVLAKLVAGTQGITQRLSPCVAPDNCVECGGCGYDHNITRQSTSSVSELMVYESLHYVSFAVLALCYGLPVFLFHTTLVSRWLVMPTPAT